MSSKRVDNYGIDLEWREIAICAFQDDTFLFPIAPL